MAAKVAKRLSAILLGLFILGCRGEARPRSLAEIQAERETLPALFITPGGKQITKPGNTGVFVDGATREIAWPAYACENPACPGRKTDGSANLFIWADARFFVTPEGTLGTHDFATAESWAEAVKQAGGQTRPTCPECLKTRDLARETPSQREQFASFVHLYELPATAKRRVELDTEWKTRKAP